jgi:multidrug transporter EmrE-like cation transporter
VLESFAVVFLWVALATYADILVKASASFASIGFLIGLVCYASTAFLAVIASHQQQWGWVIIVWNCFFFVLAMLLSVLLFHEPFTLKRAAASSFVLLALFLND